MSSKLACAHTLTQMRHAQSHTCSNSQICSLSHRCFHSSMFSNVPACKCTGMRVWNAPTYTRPRYTCKLEHSKALSCMHTRTFVHTQNCAKPAQSHVHSLAYTHTDVYKCSIFTIIFITPVKSSANISNWTKLLLM